MSRFGALLGRELRLAARSPGEAATATSFFVVAALLFPFGVGPEPALLARIAAGVLWVSALLAALLSLGRLFRDDYEDGSLELLLLSPVAPELAAGAKCLAHWLTTGLPLAVATPVIGVFLNFDAAGSWALAAALALGTPTISLVGALGAALTLGAGRAGVLLPLLALPLLIPVLIFGAGAVDAALAGEDPRRPLLMLGAMLAASCVLAPWAAAAAMRQAVE